jgi:hypothetical protein
VPEINISNSAGRDAAVSAESVRSPLKVRWIDRQGRQASAARVLKAPLDRDFDSLRAAFGDPAGVGAALIEGDPEIDTEKTGRLLRDTARVYVDPDRRTVHRVQLWERVMNPDGSERERRPLRVLAPNLSAEVPLKWTGKFIPKDEARGKFVFGRQLQLVHVNGLTYDFLYGMAKDLEERGSLMLVGGGPKGNQPLILRRGGSPYRGFLEGRTDGERYCLVLHLSNLELKAPPEAAPEAPSGSNEAES